MSQQIMEDANHLIDQRFKNIPIVNNDSQEFFAFIQDIFESIQPLKMLEHWLYTGSTLNERDISRHAYFCRYHR